VGDSDEGLGLQHFNIFYSRNKFYRTDQRINGKKTFLFSNVDVGVQ
jgi:hypothetical protein